jgi:hypothetical protein
VKPLLEANTKAARPARATTNFFMLRTGVKIRGIAAFTAAADAGCAHPQA